MRDMETIGTVYTLRKPGTWSSQRAYARCVETINRIIAVFPRREQKQIRLQLAAVLRAVISQRLVKRCDAKAACRQSRS